MASRPSGTITFLFTDVAGSTRRWEQHPAAMRAALARHDQLVRTTLEEHDGAIFTTAGDQFCAAFSSALGAVEAAVTAQLRLGGEEWGEVAPFLVRMAIHTGHAEERDGDYFGPPLNRCARLLSTGHGGQILVSQSTAQLVAEALPAAWELRDLGDHQLRDLERPERIFQVVHPDLVADFPPLRSGSRLDAADLLATGRQAHAEERWQDAYRALTAAGEARELTSDDLQRLGEAAWWIGRIEESISLREKAYGAFVREGKTDAAALTAVALAETFYHRQARTVSNAWTERAERLLAGCEDTVACGYLLRWKTVLAFESEGDPEAALQMAEEVIALGTALGERNLEALGLQDKGRILVATGRVGEGLALVDQAMVAAVGGELDSQTAGRSYCNMLGVCEEVADYRRAREWSDAAAAWCESHAESAFPGICRVYKAEVKWLQGDWEDAAGEARRAADELASLSAIAGAAWYQLGEIDLRGGRLEAAEQHFRRAHEHGRTPLPGMAALQLARGDVAGARGLMADALLESGQGPLARARLLPTWIDILISQGDHQEARAALDELAATAEMAGSEAMRAAERHRRGLLALREGRTSDALEALRAAARSWTDLDVPYEAAMSRMDLAEAMREAGNTAAADLELEAARGALRRLGVDPDERGQPARNSR